MSPGAKGVLLPGRRLAAEEVGGAQGRPGPRRCSAAMQRFGKPARRAVVAMSAAYTAVLRCPGALASRRVGRPRTRADEGSCNRAGRAHRLSSLSGCQAACPSPSEAASRRAEPPGASHMARKTVCESPNVLRPRCFGAEHAEGDEFSQAGTEPLACRNGGRSCLERRRCKVHVSSREGAAVGASCGVVDRRSASSWRVVAATPAGGCDHASLRRRAEALDRQFAA